MTQRSFLERMPSKMPIRRYLDEKVGVPARIALYYFLFGICWILFSDVTLLWSDLSTLRGYLVSSSKGILFVTLSAGLIYVLLRQYVHDLHKANALASAVIDHSTDAVMVKDKEGHYLMVNKTAATYVERSESAILRDGDEQIYDEQRARELRDIELRIMETGQEQSFEEIWLQNGKHRTVLTTKIPFRDTHQKIIGLITVARDITDRHRLEMQLHQSQKMEAIGRLAGGIAHDFNNLLTVIQGYCELLLASSNLNEREFESLKSMQQAASRATQLTGQLLAFSRRAMVAPRSLNLNEAILNADDLLRRLTFETITLELKLSDEPCMIQADPTQMDQVLMNLVLNARDAMPQGGTIRIETKLLNAAGHDGEKIGELADPMVELTVSDTGRGMPESVQAHIFEPFFTTKEVGKGTGLGLAVVHGIVNQAHGVISVISALGKGTTFRLRFPVVQPVDTLVKPVGQSNEAGTERVLLVEDEENVRNLLQLTLEAAGYKVVASATATSALEWVHHMQSAPDILVADLVMPGMGGRELAEILRAEYPTVKILFMSGYSDETLSELGIGKDFGAFLQKPFGPQEFIKSVRNVLDGSESGEKGVRADHSQHV